MADGQTTLRLTPLALLQRLAGLVPPPKTHSIHYFGGFASHASLRRRFVPRSPPVRRRCWAEGIIGIPVALLMPVVAIFVFLMGMATLARVLGGRMPIAAAKRSPVIALAIGVGLFFVIAQLPILGFLVMFGASTLAIGSVLRTGFGTRQTPPPAATGPSAV